MSVNERRKYLKRMKGRYVAAKRAERGRLLSEMEQVTGLHRKSLTRLMHAGSLERKKRTTPRPRSYGLEVERIIVRVSGEWGKVGTTSVPSGSHQACLRWLSTWHAANR